MQAVLEEAISGVTQEPVRLVGSGRTDAGAHALGQVVAFSTGSSLPASTLIRAANAKLPFDVAITSGAEVRQDFHPRYDALSRVYRYLIWNRPVRSPFWHERAAYVPQRLDTRAMAAALHLLEGRHDFSSFVPAAEERTRERVLLRTACDRYQELVFVELEGVGFMRQMVRSIVGTAIDVGLGKLTLSGFAEIFAARDRRRAGRTAPASGLYLVDVRYSDEDEEQLQRTFRARPVRLNGLETE